MNRLRNISNHFWQARYQFLKYALIGGSGFVLDMSTLIFLKEKIGLNPILSVVLNQIFMINYIFFLNKYWTFKAKGITREQMIRFWMLALWNYMFAVVIMYLGYGIMEFNYILVRILSIAVVVSWNFILYKHWVFVENRVGIKSLFFSLKSVFIK